MYYIVCLLANEAKYLYIVKIINALHTNYLAFGVLNSKCCIQSIQLLSLLQPISFSISMVRNCLNK